MRKALVKDGLIVNVISLPDDFEGSEWDGCELIDEGDIGDQYVEGKVIKRVKTPKIKEPTQEEILMEAIKAKLTEEDLTAAKERLSGDRP